MNNQEIPGGGDTTLYQNNPKRNNIPKHDLLAFFGVVALCKYFGFSFERALNHTLNPEIKKIVTKLQITLQDK